MSLLLSRCCAAFSLSCLALAVAAQTAGSAPVAASAPAPRWLPGNSTLPISMTLLPRGLKSGRDQPVFNNYRPLVLFSGEVQPLSCALRIPDPPEKIDPGQTLDIGLRCVDNFRILPGHPEFTLYEGDRLVGRGQLLDVDKPR